MPAPTIFSYTVEDAEGLSASIPIYVAYDAATETIASLQGAAAAFGALIDAITDGKITGFSIFVPFLPDPGWKTAAVANCDVEEGGLFNFTQANTIYVQEILIPALKQAILTNGKIVLTQAAVAAFTAGIIAGSGAVFPNSKYLNDLTGLKNASKTFRKHRKTQRARSLVTP
jgi:hypothetical protein